VSSPAGKNVGTVSRVDSDFFASLSAFCVCALSVGDAGTLKWADVSARLYRKEHSVLFENIRMGR
jgi:hypothetical protein